MSLLQSLHGFIQALEEYQQKSNCELIVFEVSEANQNLALSVSQMFCACMIMIPL